MGEQAGGPEDGDDARVVHAVALLGLPAMTPARLARLLDGFDPSLGVARGGCRGSPWRTHPERPVRVGRPSRRMSPPSGMRTSRPACRYCSSRWPVTRSAARRDPGQPAVLFARAASTCACRSSAERGHRRNPRRDPRSARHGRRDRRRCLSSRSDRRFGLAKGIDGAAHTVVVRRHDPGAEPVAVVGTGLDVAYPRSQSAAWAAVGEHGAVVSEQPLQTPPRRRVFPARNRIIAALFLTVVVSVECHHRGGSLYTAEAAAAARGIPVGAVPGSVRSPASSGCNVLIADGCFPVRDAADVLCAIELAQAEPVARPCAGPTEARAAGTAGWRPRRPRGSASARCRPSGGRAAQRRAGRRPEAVPGSSDRPRDGSAGGRVCRLPLSPSPARSSSTVRRCDRSRPAGAGLTAKHADQAGGKLPVCQPIAVELTGPGSVGTRVPEQNSWPNGLGAVPSGSARRGQTSQPPRRPSEW